jgi:predicted enzyme related to lactoylglutathione lyase
MHPPRFDHKDSGAGPTASLRPRLAGFACLLGLLLSACAAISPSLPPVADRATGLTLPGKIVWHDLISHTPDQCQRFYETLFGWEFERVGVSLAGAADVDYRLIRHRGRLLGGMVDARQLGQPDPQQLSQWLAVMSVGEIEAATSRVAPQGGTVRRGPVDVQARGRLTLIEDVRGAELALLETRDGDPEDSTPAVGDFLWDEVWTDDVSATSAFYNRVAGLDVGDQSTERGSQYRTLSSGDTPRAGVLPMPFEGLTSVWVSYVRVDDPEAITARVAELGGSVLVDVRQRDIGGEAALIADPSGAVIAIQTWTPAPEQAARTGRDGAAR